MILRGLVGLASICIIAFTGYYFWGEWQRRSVDPIATFGAAGPAMPSQHRLAAGAGVASSPVFTNADCDQLIGTINSTRYNALSKDQRQAIYTTYLQGCMGVGPAPGSRP